MFVAGLEFLSEVFVSGVEVGGVGKEVRREGVGEKGELVVEGNGSVAHGQEVQRTEQKGSSTS